MRGRCMIGRSLVQHVWMALQKRRVDPHLRQWVCQRALEDGTAKTPGQAANMLDCKVPLPSVSDWEIRELSSMRAEMHLRFREARAIGCAWDGIRLGNPAKEYLVTVLSELFTGAHAPLPPQEP